ncbi:hexitol phosphatase HxpB [Gallaecimonas sp. GXIMD4217]|uniref:hexitol phosphatase HxpB n=1 Tax=Gallaecimonas sp. GXIMD4217 TaxID=3131927 RepID=UPI00311B3DB9
MSFSAVIFDMDGILMDSEPFWARAELDVFNTLGLELTLADTLKTQGMRIDAVVDYWYRRRPWQGMDREQVAKTIVAQVCARVHREGEPLPGAVELVTSLKALGLPLGLATSSPWLLVGAILERLQLQDAFDQLASAEDEPRGKPHPGVYLSCARALGVEPECCLAIEDSVNGVIAAKAAAMAVLAVPQGEDPRFVIADWQAESLSRLPPALSKRLSLEPG